MLDDMINDEEKKPLILEYAKLATKKLQRNISKSEEERMLEIKSRLFLPHKEIIKMATSIIIGN